MPRNEVIEKGGKMSGWNLYYPEKERPKLKYLVTIRNERSPSETLRNLVDEEIERKQKKEK